MRDCIESGPRLITQPSKPLLGKVSGKWSIQFTRPILGSKGFAGEGSRKLCVDVPVVESGGAAMVQRLSPQPPASGRPADSS